jgi:hypothetical protein
VTGVQTCALPISRQEPMDLIKDEAMTEGLDAPSLLSEAAVRSAAEPDGVVRGDARASPRSPITFSSAPSAWSSLRSSTRI